MDLECQILQFFSLSFIIILVSFFLYRETNPEKKLEKKDGYGITII